MYYLIQRAGHFYFNRRVPGEFRIFDKRDVVRKSLKTTDRKTALRLAMVQNDQLEAFWTGLNTAGLEDTPEEYKALHDRPRILGFSYVPSPSVAALPLL